ncbi:hypothetical protein N008_05335 [Hymenobacter sp. APR13]|nr:hypothetical protein N008_05335 [Hymenobacter sp. APR13]
MRLKKSVMQSTENVMQSAAEGEAKHLASVVKPKPSND